MSSTVTISCILNTTDPAATLGFEAWVDDTKFIDIGAGADNPFPF